MTIRAWTLTLTVSLCLAAQGCGDDDSGGSGDNNAGSGGSGGRSSGAGSGARAGSGAGNAGSGSNSDNPFAECMLEDMMMGASTAGCEGIDEYGQCVQDECLDDCMSQCQSYFDCVQDAADPCNPSGCTPSSECTSCLAGATSCYTDCFRLVMCGETTPGGACDQLDDCCASSSMPMLCEQAAAGARAVGGDQACMALMGAFCM